MPEYIDRQTVLDSLQAPEMFGITPYHECLPRTAVFASEIGAIEAWNRRDDK